MRALLSLLFLFATAQAYGSSEGLRSLILEYRFNNQVVGSAMEVYSDGSGQRRERECCPPKNTVVENFQLTEKELKVLTSWIDESAIGPIHTEKSNGRMGERFGLFSVSTSTGDKIVIRSRDIQQLQSNQSEAAVKLLNWVNARANQKMQ